jgi:hypothetical protein
MLILNVIMQSVVAPFTQDKDKLQLKVLNLARVFNSLSSCTCTMRLWYCKVKGQN